MSRKYFIILGLFLAAGFLFTNAERASADWSWTGGGDKTTWTDRSNWGATCAGCYPGATSTGDIVTIGPNSDNSATTIYATTTLYGLGQVKLQTGTGGSPTLIIGNGATVNASSSELMVSSTSTLKLGDSTWGSGTLKLLNGNTNAVPLRLLPTAAFTAATGTVTYVGTGGNIVIATTTYYNLTLTPTSTTATRTYKFAGGSSTCTTGGCTATTTVSNVLTADLAAQANFDSVAVVLSGSGTVFSKANGTFVANGSLVKYTNASAATDVATGTYANLVISGAGITKTLLGNTTATSTVSVESGTLAISTFTFTATGATWTNSSTVTEGTGGKIVLASAMVVSNSAGGSAVSEFGNADTNPVVHVQVTDTSLNLLNASVETQTATVTATSMITDSEAVTLTETGAGTGIFRGRIAFQSSGTHVAGVLDYQAGGSLSISFTDSQDSNDTASGSGNFTGSAPGGGGGGSVAAAATPAVPATPATPAVPTETPAVPATPATPAVPSLESVQSKVASVVARIAALPAKPSADDLTSIQAEIAAILVELQSIQAAQPTPQGVALGFNFVRPLALGMTHNDVRNLQTALKTDSAVYPEGTVTGYFGPATLKAVQKFQEKYGIADSGDPGYGNVGPKTRAKLSELYGGK